MTRPHESNPPDSAETNPLPKVSSARAWTSLSFPKPSPIIREKAGAPVPPRRVRADGTQEICAEDIMLIVPKATLPPPRPKQPSTDPPQAGRRARLPSSEELSDDDIVVEVAAPQQEEFRPPAYSIHATQEILADDVLEVADAPLPPPPHRDEIPSTVPWTVDTGDDLEFPTPPKYSGPFPAVQPRITSFSATQVLRRRSVNLKVVIASMSLAAGVVLVSGIARLARVGSSPGAETSGPIGIALHAPKTLDTTIRTGTLAFGTAPHVEETTAVSIDALPEVQPHHAWRWHRRWHRHR